MPLGGFTRREGAQVSTLAGFRVLLAGVETILSRRQFPYHALLPFADLS